MIGIGYSGADPGFQVRGCALKQIAPSEGRRENFWGISCVNRKNMIFLRKIVIFHTKYPKYFRAFLCNWKKYDF
jgi:hypothetical protein